MKTRGYTTIEQSKKLFEIGIPADSADMVYFKYATSDNPTFRFDNPPMVLCDIPINEIEEEKLPCWSLTSLLELMPSVIKRKEKRMFLTLEKAGAYNLYYKSPDRLDEIWFTKEDAIDACVDMIVHLKEEGLL